MNWLIELPVETSAAVVALVIALLGVAIRFVSMYVPWLGEFLEKYKEEWGTALGILVVNILQQYLPGGEWAGVMVMSVQLVVAVAVVLLAKFGLAKAGVRGFKQ